MTSINKSIEEVIQTLYDTIKSKNEIINYFRKNNNINNEKEQLITIQRLKLIDFIDEFEITVSQSLQAIQTLQIELSNLKENKEGKLINRTNLDSKIENSNLNLSNLNSIYYCNKLNIQQKEKKELKKEIENRSININKTNDLINKVISNETKLNFDYSKLASKINNNESELSLITNPNNTNYIKEKNNVLKDDEKLIPEVSNIILSESNEQEPEIEQIKIPIRQSLRKIISIGNKNENKENNINNNSNNLINDEKGNKIKNIISKINSEESYKIYLSNKYSKGEYNQFLKMLNNNEIDFDSLENEIKIITDLINTDRNIRKQRNNIYKNNNNIFNNNNNKYIKSSNHSRNNSKGKNIFYSNDENPNEYMEPLNFANFLRGDYNIKKNKNKNLSKKKHSKDK